MQSLYILCPKDNYTKYYWGCNHCTTIYTFGFLRCFFQNTAQDNLNTSPPVFLCLFVSSLFVFIRMLSALECCVSSGDNPTQRHLRHIQCLLSQSLLDSTNLFLFWCSKFVNLFFFKLMVVMVMTL